MKKIIEIKKQNNIDFMLDQHIKENIQHED